MKLKTLYILSFLVLVLSCTNKEKKENKTTDLQKLNMDLPLTKLLKKVSVNAIELKDIKFSNDIQKNEWLGKKPATKKQIQEVEEKLNLKLPKEYVDFLLITNGFEATSNIYPKFHPIDKIDLLENIDKYQINLWMQEGTEEIGLKMKRSIIVAGIQEEQYFLLIPPIENENWEYWSFASWYPGEVVYKDFKSFWIEVNEFLKESKN